MAQEETELLTLGDEPAEGYVFLNNGSWLQ